MGGGDPHAAAARRARGGRAHFRGWRPMMDVIIVDDEPAARRTVRECCEREGDFKAAGNSGERGAALGAIRERLPHVLFLDIEMDAMTGMALARALDPQN